MSQCRALTKEGKQCRNKESVGGYCHIQSHRNCPSSRVVGAGGAARAASPVRATSPRRATSPPRAPVNPNLVRIQQVMGRIVDAVVPLLMNPDLVDRQKAINLLTEHFVETRGYTFKDFLVKNMGLIQEFGRDALNSEDRAQYGLIQLLFPGDYLTYTTDQSREEAYELGGGIYYDFMHELFREAKINGDARPDAYFDQIAEDYSQSLKSKAGAQ